MARNWGRPWWGEAIGHFVAGARPTVQPQDKSKVTQSTQVAKRGRQDRLVEGSSGPDVHDLVRAMPPCPPPRPPRHPPARVQAPVRLIVHKNRRVIAQGLPGRFPGRLTRIASAWPASEGGAVRLLTRPVPGQKAMRPSSSLRGQSVLPGDRFGE